MKKSTKLGLPPGVAQYSGDLGDRPVKIEVINYQYRSDINQILRKQVPLDNLEEAFSLISEHSITWIDVQGVHNVALMEQIADHFQFHPVLKEDLLSTQQRPKLDGYDELVVFFLRRAFDDAETIEFETDQIAIVLGSNVVVSFNELDDDKFRPVKEMIDDHQELFSRHRHDFFGIYPA